MRINRSRGVISPLGGSCSLVQLLKVLVCFAVPSMEQAADVWWFAAPDMSQGKAGCFSWYVRGTGAASCSALPDPGCSCGSLSAGVVRTRDLNHSPVSAVLAMSTFRFFLGFFLA